MQKEIYYYVRDEKNRPMVTVCLLMDAFGDVARGVAFCSIRDNPSKRVGRKIAKQRATTSVIYKDNYCPLRIPVTIGGTVFAWKSEYLPEELTILEKKLLYGDLCDE